MENYDNINPQHYKNYSIEVISMMEAIWGRDYLIKYCEMNAFKYRMRAGTKPTSNIEEDLAKEKWYLNKANELRK